MAPMVPDPHRIKSFPNGAAFEKWLAGHHDSGAELMRWKRWLAYGTWAWAILFAAPRACWALGIPAGFPGGAAHHRVMFTSIWRYTVDLIVIVICAMTVLIVLTLQRPPEQVTRRWIPYSVAWFGSGPLTLRGVAGLVVDGSSDPIWWPTFLVGGVLLGSVAWNARRRPGKTS